MHHRQAKTRKRHKTISLTAAVHDKFTEDLLIEVLLRLPLKSLSRFKSVCKSWFFLISSCAFIKSHIRHVVASTGYDETLIVVDESDNTQVGYGAFSLFHVGSGQLVANLKLPCYQGEYPDVPICKLIGSDSGIVCVSVHVSDWSNNDYDIYLWYPATKQSKLIPAYTVSYNGEMEEALGFGFDPIDNDVKVVRIFKLLAYTIIFALVYSSNGNTWRDTNDIDPIDFPKSHGFDICLHGFLFGTGYNGMMAFDLNKEVLICNIKFPVESHKSFVARVTDFKDSIAVIVSTMCEELDDKVNLWTLDDEACLRGDGVEASWTRILSIDVGVRLHNIEGLFNNVEFLLRAQNGDRLLYNSENKETRYVTHAPFFQYHEVFKYCESGLPVTWTKVVNWTDHEDDSSGRSADVSY